MGSLPDRGIRSSTSRSSTALWQLVLVRQAARSPNAPRKFGPSLLHCDTDAVYLRAVGERPSRSPQAIVGRIGLFEARLRASRPLPCVDAHLAGLLSLAPKVREGKAATNRFEAALCSGCLVGALDLKCKFLGVRPLLHFRSTGWSGRKVWDFQTVDQ